MAIAQARRYKHQVPPGRRLPRLVQTLVQSRLSWFSVLVLCIAVYMMAASPYVTGTTLGTPQPASSDPT